MKKLISLMLLLLMVFSISGCGEKEPKYRLVAQYETQSEIMYGIELGMSEKEYLKSDAHKIMKDAAGKTEVRNSEDGLPENFVKYDYYDLVDNSGRESIKDCVHYATAEFVDDKLASLSLCLNKTGGTESDMIFNQSHITDAYQQMARQMGFTEPIKFHNTRRPLVVYEGHLLYDSLDENNLNSFVCDWGSKYDMLKGRRHEGDYLQLIATETMYTIKDVKYYLSEDTTKAIAVIPQDMHSQRYSVTIPGDDPSWRLGDEYTLDTLYAPVFVTYYDVEAIRENMHIFGGRTDYLVNPCTVELLKSLNDIGIIATREKYEDVIDFDD